MIRVTETARRVVRELTVHSISARVHVADEVRAEYPVAFIGSVGLMPIVTMASVSGLISTSNRRLYQFAIASRNPTPEAIELLRGYGVEVLPINADVSQEEQVVRMVETTLAHFGHLDHYVNNAAWEWHEPVTRITTEGWMNTRYQDVFWHPKSLSRRMG